MANASDVTYIRTTIQETQELLLHNYKLCWR